MAAIFECLKLLSGPPEETMERLICTQKLCGALKDRMDICLLQFPWKGHFSYI